MNCLPHNSYVEALRPRVTVPGDGAYKEVRKVKYGPDLTGLCFYERRNRHQSALSLHAQKRGRVGTGEKVAVAYKQESLHQKPTPIAP